jgi:hypothetical protein
MHNTLYPTTNEDTYNYLHFISLLINQNHMYITTVRNVQLIIYSEWTAIIFRECLQLTDQINAQIN